MTVRVQDTFTDTNGTSLTSHTPDIDVVGNGWAAHSNDSTDTPAPGEIQSNALQFQTNGDGCAIDAGISDGKCSVDWHTVAAQNNRGSMFVRASGTSDTIQVNFRVPNQDINIYERVSDGIVTLVNSEPYSWTAGNSYALRVEVDGTSIEFYVDDVLEASTTSSAQLSATKYGLRRDGSDTGMTFDDFVVETFDTSVALTGVSTTAGVGTLSVTGGATVPVSGVSATGHAGVLVVTGGAVVPLTGVQATSAIGDMIASGGALLVLDGVSASGQPGSVTVLGNAIAELTGVQATGNIGDLIVTGGANALLSGVQSTVSAGEFAVIGNAVVSLNGVSATGQVGSITIETEGGVTVSLTGVQATAEAGDLSAIGGALAALVGVEASSVVGVLDITGGASVTLTGVQADGQAGDITIPSAAIVVPGYRIYTIEHQDRTYLIVAQDRTYTIH